MHRICPFFFSVHRPASVWWIMRTNDDSGMERVPHAVRAHQLEHPLIDKYFGREILWRTRDNNANTSWTEGRCWYKGEVLIQYFTNR